MSFASIVGPNDGERLCHSNWHFKQAALMTMCTSFWLCACLRKHCVASRQSKTALIINCHNHRNVIQKLWAIQFMKMLLIFVGSLLIARDLSICFFFPVWWDLEFKTKQPNRFNCKLSIKRMCALLIDRGKIQKNFFCTHFKLYENITKIHKHEMKQWIKIAM